MSTYEMDAYLQYQKYAHMDDWEQSRLIAYLQAQTNSTKKLKPTDIIQFDWDKKSDEQRVTEEDRQATIEWTKRISELMQHEEE